MKYRSTRGLERGLSFEDVLLAGYSRDNGMYMPEEIPLLSEEELATWAVLTYPQLVYEIVRKFISVSELGNDELKKAFEGSFQRFSHPDVVNVKVLPTVSVIELYHGPTLAFKDLALTVAGSLLNVFLTRSNNKKICLVGTSGDTGSASIEAVRGLKNIDIIVLYPKGRVTRVQELQMTTVMESNVHVFAVEGTSDDLDVPIKKCFADRDFAAKHQLISINSLNWVRIMAQIPMYFYSYYKVRAEELKGVEIVVPTGAAGNITAGCIASKMGLPIRIVAAVNENDMMERAWKSGNFEAYDFVKATYSSAMDIQIPYNIERLLFIFSDCDASKVKAWMDEFESKGRFQIPEDVLSKFRAVITDSHAVSDVRIIETIKRLSEEFNYIVCPHTAVALAYHYHRAPTTNRGVMATASPSKFPEVIEAAGETAPSAGTEHLKGKPEEDVHLMKKGEDWLTFLKKEIVNISEKRRKSK